MKKLELLFSVLLVPVDFIMIVLAALSAYYLRFTGLAVTIRPVIFDFDIKNYFTIVLVVALIWILIFFMTGLYNLQRSRRLTEEIRRVFLACSAGFVLIAVYIFFQRELFNSRFIVLAAWILSMIYVLFGRGLLHIIHNLVYRSGYGVRQLVIVGAGKTADSLVKEFSQKKQLGYKVIKRLRDFSLETSQELDELVDEGKVDEIIQADPNISKSESLRLYDFATDRHIVFRYVADLLGVKVLHHEVTELAGLPIVEVKRTTLEGWGQVAKRLTDIIISGLLIIILSPIILLAAIIIKLDSKGPVFFSRRDDGSYVKRVGQNGKAFRYFKFRSMIDRADSLRYTELADRNLRTDGPLVKIKNDPRVTRFGRFIRRFSIDELPELFLVFMGKMSLVGPRPHLPEEVAKYEQHHRKVLTIKPGISGLAQISGRSDLAFEEEVRLDLYYIENWSMLLDISILLKTPWAVIKHRQTE